MDTLYFLVPLLYLNLNKAFATIVLKRKQIILNLKLYRFEIERGYTSGET